MNNYIKAFYYILIQSLWQMATNLNVGWLASGKYANNSKYAPNRLNYSEIFIMYT